MLFNKILLATDGSGPSNKAAEYALAMLKDNPEAQVTAVTVNKVGHEMTYDAKMYSPEMKAAVDEAAKRRLDSVLEIFRSAGYEVESVCLPGDPGQMISRFAEENHFDVIIMGKTGAGNISGIFFGSVARKVVGLSKVPVLLVS